MDVVTRPITCAVEGIKWLFASFVNSLKTENLYICKAMKDLTSSLLKICSNQSLVMEDDGSRKEVTITTSQWDLRKVSFKSFFAFTTSNITISPPV